MLGEEISQKEVEEWFPKITRIGIHLTAIYNEWNSNQDKEIWEKKKILNIKIISVFLKLIIHHKIRLQVLYYSYVLVGVRAVLRS